MKRVAKPKGPHDAFVKYTFSNLENAAAMLRSALPQGPINYDLLPNLFMMAQDGFVINRRLNDIRDMEGLVDTMCKILMNSVEGKPRQHPKLR